MISFFSYGLLAQETETLNIDKNGLVDVKYADG